MNNKDLSLEQHTALPDDEKGKYREVWEWSDNNSNWNEATVFDYENFQSYYTWIESDFIYLNPEYDTRQVFRLIEQPVEEKEFGVAWIDINNNLPEIGLPVLVYMNGRVTNKPILKVDELISANKWRFTSDGFITHWMNLPTPPKTLTT